MISVVWRADQRGKAPVLLLPPLVEVLVRALVGGIKAAHQPVCQHRAGQAFGNQIGIVVERGEDLGQHLRLPRRPGHAINLSLQLAAGDGTLPELRQCVGAAQLIFHPGSQGLRWQHLLQVWLRRRILGRPDAMAPVNLLDRLAADQPGLKVQRAG